MVKKRTKLRQLFFQLSHVKRNVDEIDEIKLSFNRVKVQCEKLMNTRENLVNVLNDALKQSQRGWTHWNYHQICSWFKFILKNQSAKAIESISWQMVEKRMKIHRVYGHYLFKCNDLQLRQFGISNQTHRDVLLKMIKKLVQENDSSDKMYNATRCVICLENKANVRLLPCNHVCMCNMCIGNFLQKSNPAQCPLCRVSIGSTQMRQFLSNTYWSIQEQQSDNESQ